MITIRPCRREDLRRLEWTHELAADRRTIRWAFDEAERGRMRFLVAAHGADPVGQVWIDIVRKWPIAVLWALRTRPAWRRIGLGTLLVLAGEREARRAGAEACELAVTSENLRARALYVQLGYAPAGCEPALDAITGAPLGHELQLLRRML